MKKKYMEAVSREERKRKKKRHKKNLEKSEGTMSAMKTCK